MIKRKRWNLAGYVATVFITCFLVGLIFIAPSFQKELQYIIYALSIFVVIAIIAIVTRNIKNKTNNNKSK